MDITIHLSPEEEKALENRAAASGEDIRDYVIRIVVRAARGPVALNARLAPVRREFAESGLSDDELDALVEEAREEVWREKHPGPSDAS